MTMLKTYAQEAGFAVTDDWLKAVAFLEARGLHEFCEFGYSNALEKAHAIWRSEGVM